MLSRSLPKSWDQKWSCSHEERLAVVVKVTFPILLVVFWENVIYLFAEGLHYHATKTGRTAGSNPCLWGKWIPEKMHTPTCLPKTRKATCTKSSVSQTQSRPRGPCFIMRNRIVFNRRSLSPQSITWSQSAWTPTTNSGECYLGLLTVLCLS